MDNFLEIYIPFFSDYGFKATFGNEKNTLFLRRALQALIQSDIEIEAVELGKHTIEGFTQDSRGGVFDVVCRAADGTEFIVEMQRPRFAHMVQRMKFYAFHKIDSMIRRGNLKFENLPKLYCIAILKFKLFSSDDYYTRAVLRDDKNNSVDNQMEFIFVELEKFKKLAEDCITDLDKLIFTMKEAHELMKSGELPEFMEEDWLQVAIKELDTRRLPPDEYANLAIAVAREASERAADAEGKREKWAEEFFKEWGVKEGMERGIDIGQEILIGNMIISSGWDDQAIAQMLGVPQEMVEKVRKSMNLDSSENK